MIYTDKTKRAMKLCYKAHHGQVDKSGLPYFHHPLHLAEQMDDEDSTVVTLLHDVVEDTDYTLNDIKGMDFGDEVVEALKLLTHDPAEEYMDYIEKIKSDPLAVKVKIADLRHNSDLSRLNHEPTDKDYQRVRKYRKALTTLIVHTTLEMGGFNDDKIDPVEADLYAGWVTESLVDDYCMTEADAAAAVKQFDLISKVIDAPMIAHHDDPRNIAEDIAELHLTEEELIKRRVILTLEFACGINREESALFLKNFDIPEMISKDPDVHYTTHAEAILREHPAYSEISKRRYGL